LQPPLGLPPGVFGASRVLRGVGGGVPGIPIYAYHPPTERWGGVVPLGPLECLFRKGCTQPFLKGGGGTTVGVDTRWGPPHTDTEHGGTAMETPEHFPQGPSTLDTGRGATLDTGNTTLYTPHHTTRERWRWYTREWGRGSGGFHRGVSILYPTRERARGPYMFVRGPCPCTRRHPLEGGSTVRGGGLQPSQEWSRRAP